MCLKPDVRSKTNIVNNEEFRKEVGVKAITAKELSLHNTPSDAWAAVHGNVLNITQFARTHPGGDIILLAAGKDATVLFETYHPRGVSSSLVEKLKVGTMKEGEIKNSYYSWDSEFYRVLKQRVVARLDERRLARRGGHEITLKAILIICGFWMSLYQMCRQTENLVLAAIFSVLLGIFAGEIGVNIQHDGNHGAFSVKKNLNKIAGWTMDMIGSSGFTWEIQHMLGHHPYTNVLDWEEEVKKAAGVDCALEQKDQESDPDVFSSFPLMRMHPAHTPAWFHRYQHIYGPIIFSLMTVSKVVAQDFEVFFNKRLSHIDASCRYDSTFNVVRFIVMKVLSVLYMVGLPCFFHGVRKGLSLFFLSHLVCGEFLASMFIVNHVIEGVSYGLKNHGKGEEGEEVRPRTLDGITPMRLTRSASKAQVKVPYNDWAAVQCQTSVNWSSGSWFWNHFSGGLNHQIEHHLFPSIVHTNYVHIQDVVESTCIEYGVPYQSEPSLFTAYKKMIFHLKHLGTSKQDKES